jgi:hypothetical protein
LLRPLVEPADPRPLQVQCEVDRVTGEPVAVETHVHLPSAHVAAARHAGFTAIELHEGVIDDAWIRRKPQWQTYRDWPISFAWVWRCAIRAGRAL